MRLNLAGKAFLLLSVPLAFQIGLFARLLTIQDQAADDLVNLSHPIEVNAELSRVMITAIQVGAAFNSQDPTFLLTQEFMELRTSGLESIKRLRIMLDKEAASRAIIENLSDLSARLMAIVDTNSDQLSIELAGKAKNTKLPKMLDAEYEKFSAQLPVIGTLIDRQTDIARDDTNSLLSHTEQFDRTLQYGLFAEAILLVASLLWFRYDIAHRFSTIIDNSLRLARDKTLHAPLGGNDEIAAIDSTFHEMARQLADARQTERAIIENSGAVICAVSDKMAFIKVNPASREVFGYEPEELLQMRLARLIAGTEDPVDLFDAVKSGLSQSFELRCRRKNGEQIDTEWSVDWSKERQQFFCTIHDASERKNAERLREELVHLISSGLQKPLSTISSIIPKIENSIPEEQRYLVPALNFANNQMLMLVRDLIDMEQIESGTLRFQRSATSLSQIASQAIHLVSGHALRQGVKVEDHIVQAELYADKDRLIQVFVNLLSNAIKFSSRDSVVRIEAEDCADSVMLSVVDHGRGIPPEVLPVIFDRFRQTEVGDARTKGGSGLGLAICQALIELHESSISVASSEAGTRFSFKIARAGPGGTAT